MKLVAFNKFGLTKMVPLITYTNGIKDNPPKEKYDAELWIESGEDYYALDYYKREKKTVLVVERSDWLKGVVKND